MEYPEKLICISCGTHVLTKKYFSAFKCPNCGKEWIVRCSTCKALSREYKCPSCGFVGP
ncbi:MAG: RNA-binding protein [Candidatus Aenigmarchaeota archaeon ex4484_224]|nr:MAG: RNA-binding protein [Candidatus Aenigmarchaeota archaeon ex4484_224]